MLVLATAINKAPGLVPLRDKQHSSDARFGMRLQAPYTVGPARSHLVALVKSAVRRVFL
jgi:hypothetical protein